MEDQIFKSITNALSKSNLQGSGEFHAEAELTATDIKVNVDGLGDLTFPLNLEFIEKLISVSSKARFGLREQTVLNENVRNTQEIKSDRLSVTIKEHALSRMLNNMRDKLSLNKNTTLTPHLHNMLIYGPGQFFDTHQDSEKLENMVATLVLVLPSPHVGGNLVIKHGNEDHTFFSQNVYATNIKCIAFYADCMHKVEKVHDGYRIALTYNLTIKSEKSDVSKNVNQKLKKGIGDYFALASHPEKLVYLLDYEYTEQSLRWDSLKGVDGANVSAINMVAKELGLVPYLALADIRQLWDAHTDYEPYVDYRDLDYSFIENDITLSHWINEGNENLPLNQCEIKDSEVCWIKDTDSLKPYETDYEGYTGNQGCPMNRWYKRAAIVLWSNQILMNFALGYDIAINELNVLMKSPGNDKKVIEILEKAGKYLYKDQRMKNEKNDFELSVTIALYLRDEEKALLSLSCFEWEVLNSDIVEFLVKLQIQFGVEWCLKLLNNWKNKNDKRPSYFSFYFSTQRIDNISAFVSNFLFHGGEALIVEQLLNIQSDSFIDSAKTISGKDSLYSLTMRMESLEQLFLACAKVQSVQASDKLMVHVKSHPQLYPVKNLTELCKKLQLLVHPDYYEVLVKNLVKTNEKCMENDWSIDIQLRCNCEYCGKVVLFLHSKTTKSKIWPLSTAICNHIIRVFKKSISSIPVDISVDKIGSPYKLVMIKNKTGTKTFSVKVKN